MRLLRQDGRNELIGFGGPSFRLQNIRKHFRDPYGHGVALAEGEDAAADCFLEVCLRLSVGEAGAAGWRRDGPAGHSHVSG